MRLIDADDMKTDVINQVAFISLFGGEFAELAEILKKGILEEIEKAPTIDATPVVRCKDCRWGKEVCGNIECYVDLNAPAEYHGYEWFCPLGERKCDG